MSSLSVEQARRKYGCDDEAELLRKMAADYGCDRIYKYSSSNQGPDTFTDYKLILKPAHEDGLLTSPSVFNPVLVYDQGKVILPGRPPTIRFVCPKCSRGLKAPRSAAGKAFKCPSCNAPAVVPGPTDRSATKASKRSPDDLLRIARSLPVERYPRCRGCGKVMGLRAVEEKDGGLWCHFFCRSPADELCIPRYGPLEDYFGEESGHG